jgi:nucleotide-binding universal stress UspA family protein
MRIDTILHPTDFSESAEHALGVAVDLASRHGAVLYLVHGLLLHANTPGTPPLEACANKATEQATRLVEQDPTRRLPEIRVSHLHAVSPFEAIMERATQIQPDLIVMGTHGRTGIGRLLMGSTAEKVLRHAPGHVLTVKAAVQPRDPGDPRQILVPVDLSDGSAQALDAARWLARSTDTRLHLLHVVEPVPALHYAGNVENRFALDGNLRHQIEHSMQEWSGEIDGARWFVTEGHAPTEIARVARNTQADLVVMGTRGLTGLQHMLIGSVTERVCRTCETPVLVIRDAA